MLGDDTGTGSLTQTGITAFRKSAHEIELIDKLLASAESRRNKILREIAAYRNGLAQQLEKSANRIIEAEVLTHDDAVKNAVVEQADDAVKNAVVEQADDAVKNAVVEQADDAVKNAVVEQAEVA